MLTPAALLADGQWKPGFIATSQNIVKENGLTQYCRKGVIEDPWLSVGEHPSSIVYGEGSYEGHNEDDALNFGGSNVSKRRRPSLLRRSFTMELLRRSGSTASDRTRTTCGRSTGTWSSRARTGTS